MDQEWTDRLEGMGKIRINGNRLRPGILTDYQIAALADYRATQGDILSAPVVIADPELDITDELIAGLNEEYIKNKNKKD